MHAKRTRDAFADTLLYMHILPFETTRTGETRDIIWFNTTDTGTFNTRDYYERTVYENRQASIRQCMSVSVECD